MKILELSLEEIQLLYGVNPYIFLLIFVVSIPLYWYTIFKIVRIIRSQNRSQILRWVIVNIIIFIAPYAYLYTAGKNLPLLLHFLVGFTVIFSLLSLRKRVRNIKAI